jgi:flagellar export protein FliJ
MKRFKFSLEAVHNLRELQRDEVERQLARAAAIASAAETAIEEIERHRAEIETRLAGLIGELNAVEAAWQSNYLIVLAEREGQAKEHLAQLERERETHRQNVIVATREAEVTGQLRARQKARHEADVARAEQILLDEMAIITALRGGMNTK